MPSPREWWRRAAAAAKDKRSLCLSRVTGVRGRRSPAVEAAIIRATSHDERRVDYKSAGRVFAWARGAPAAFLAPLMWCLSRRAARTRSWVVALKSLLLAHGLLLCSDDAPAGARVGRLPFDLSDFLDRSAASSRSSLAFSAFVRAYFRFLDRRSFFAALEPLNSPALGSSETRTGDSSSSFDSDAADPDADLERLERLQVLLDLLLQIRPYGDGMEVGLVLEAMDCVVVEVFEVYSSICNGIAHFLVEALGDGSSANSAETSNDSPATVAGQEKATRTRRAGAAVRVLRRAAFQSSQLAAYFDLCRALGVLNATEYPPVQTIAEEDIKDIEALLLGGVSRTLRDRQERKECRAKPEAENRSQDGHSGPVATEEWVLFEDEGRSGNPFLSSPPEMWWSSASIVPSPWALTANGAGRAGVPPVAYCNMIELI